MKMMKPYLALILFGIIFCLVLFGLRLTTTNTNGNDSTVLTLESLKLSFVVGISLACLTLVEVAADFIFLRKRNIFQLSVLLSFILSIFLPNVMCLMSAYNYIDVIIWSSMYSVQNIVVIGLTFLLITYFGRLEFWIIKSPLVSFGLYVSYVIVANIVPFLDSDYQYYVRVCLLVELKVLSLLFMGVPSCRWLMFLLRAKRKDLSNHDIFCTFQLIWFWFLVICNLVIFLMTGSFFSGPFGVLTSGSITALLWNYFMMAYVILSVVVNSRIFSYEAIRQQVRLLMFLFQLIYSFQQILCRRVRRCS